MTVAWPSPTVAEIVVGADAAPCVINADDVALTELPFMFVAITLYVYEVPFVKPVHTYVVAFAPIEHVAPAGDDVTV